MTTKPTKAFVLLSGGLDSTTCLYEAIRTHGAENVIAISIDYKQRHKKEVHLAHQLCGLLKVPHIITLLGPQPQSMLTNTHEPIPDVSYDELPEGISPTYVPFRNGQLLSTIAAYASSDQFLSPDQDGVIYFGAHAEDAANWAYPDCTPEFIGAMANAIYIGTYRRVRLLAPFTYMSKSDVVTLGNKLGVPFEYTWSCYKGEGLHCGVCPTCRSRREAFIIANVDDPTKYQYDSPEL